ncbi:hypothetical protein AQUCO_01500270v1 [Aquilegia coerulea]|uniref:Uncharacterized protein n=1 Tax=Aquilegia coerulea TaxID=218851 RepID=A0A2G5DSX9_AQUCA|nr:hypothetical protein AQUCO_01500270v1 [Aquilegia coerulea]
MLPASPWTRKGFAWTIGYFVTGISLFAIGAHLSFVNIAPQQARAKARKEFVEEYILKKYRKE